MALRLRGFMDLSFLAFGFRAIVLLVRVEITGRLVLWKAIIISLFLGAFASLWGFFAVERGELWLPFVLLVCFHSV